MARPRKPTALKRMQGTLRPHRESRAEPRPAVRPPSCPSWLPDRAKREWKRIVPELLRLGLVSGLDRAALAAYCEAYAEWRDMTDVMATEGEFVVSVTKAGSRYVQPHPAMAIRNAAVARMRRFAIAFGMTPATRSRVEWAEREVGSPVAVDRWLGGADAH